jgi:hypothetical protein
MAAPKWQNTCTNNIVESHNKSFKDFLKELLVSIVVLAQHISQLFEFWPKEEQRVTAEKIRPLPRKKGIL